MNTLIWLALLYVIIGSVVSFGVAIYSVYELFTEIRPSNPRAIEQWLRNTFGDTIFVLIFWPVYMLFAICEAACSSLANYFKRNPKK